MYANQKTWVICAALIAIALLPVSAMPAWAQGCQPKYGISATVEPGKLTVSIPENAPFTTMVNGQPAGIDIEILKAIAQAECLELNVVLVSAAASIQYVIAGRADVAAGEWYRTAQRAQVMGLSAPIYLSQMAIISKEGVSTIEGLLGKRVGTVAGYMWVEPLTTLLGANLKTYPNPVALARDYEIGRIDIASDSYGYAVYAQNNGAYPNAQIKVVQPDARVPATVGVPQSNLPYAKGNVSLGAALDAHIADLHRSGAIARFLVQWGLDPSASEVGEPRIVQ